MADTPQHVVDESRANIDEWAAESRLLLATEPFTRFTATQAADLISALGHAGAGRALADAGYVISSMTDWLRRKYGQAYDDQEALSLLGMAGLILADREVPGGG